MDGRDLLLDMNDPPLDRHRHGFEPVGDAEFLEDPCGVDLDGVFADAQGDAGYLAGRAAARKD